MIVSCRLSEKNRSHIDPGIQWPAMVTAIVAAAPISDASRIFPRRNLYIYRPTNSAIGIVQAIVNVPHELPGTANTAPAGNVTRPSTAVNDSDAGTDIWNDSGRSDFGPFL